MIKLIDGEEDGECVLVIIITTIGNDASLISWRKLF